MTIKTWIKHYKLLELSISPILIRSNIYVKCGSVLDMQGLYSKLHLNQCTKATKIIIQVNVNLNLLEDTMDNAKHITLKEI